MLKSMVICILVLAFSSIGFSQTNHIKQINKVNLIINGPNNLKEEVNNYLYSELQTKYGILPVNTNVLIKLLININQVKNSNGFSITVNISVNDEELNLPNCDLKEFEEVKKLFSKLDLNKAQYVFIGNEGNIKEICKTIAYFYNSKINNVSHQ